jgi:hypothetical protein
MKIDQRHFKTVPSSTTDDKDYVIASGGTLFLRELGVCCSQDLPGVSVSILWDPAGVNDVLILSSGNTVQRSFLSFSGDGAKIIRIRLINETLIAQDMGGYFIGAI